MDKKLSGNSLKKVILKKAGVIPAFTMVELVFVIVVLGILAAVAIPRLAVTRDDAILVKGKSQVSSIRSGIAMQKSRRLLQGNTPYLTNLDDANGTNGEKLFNFSDGNVSNILEYPILARQNENGGWWYSAVRTYKFQLTNNTIVTFTYDNSNGTFTCTPAGYDCNALTQ